jgi:hypothetical protein
VIFLVAKQLRNGGVIVDKMSLQTKQSSDYLILAHPTPENVMSHY